MTKEYKEVGTKAVITTDDDDTFSKGIEVTVVEVDESSDNLTYCFTDGVNESWFSNNEFEWVEDTPEIVVDTLTTISDGAATTYYDMPYKDWVTGNDQMEYLAEYKWGKFGIHLKDIFKSTLRWGEKEGTSVEYDTRKIIYYGCRILRMIGGVDEVRRTLQKLLDDPQFQGTLDTKISEWKSDEPVMNMLSEPNPELNEPKAQAPTPKFKVGDKVYVSKESGAVSYRYVGKVGVVTSSLQSTSEGQPRYNADFDGIVQIVREDDDGLILVEEVTYDFEKMLDNPYVDFSSERLLIKFIWKETPQGYDFWCNVHDGYIEELEWMPILADMEQQYEEWKRTLQVATQ